MDNSLAGKLSCPQRHKHPPRRCWNIVDVHQLARHITVPSHYMHLPCIPLKSHEPQKVPGHPSQVIRMLPYPLTVYLVCWLHNWYYQQTPSWLRNTVDVIIWRKYISIPIPSESPFLLLPSRPPIFPSVTKTNLKIGDAWEMLRRFANSITGSYRPLPTADLLSSENEGHGSLPQF